VVEKHEVNEQQQEVTTGGIKMETLSKFIEYLVLRNIREEREEEKGNLNRGNNDRRI